MRNTNKPKVRVAAILKLCVAVSIAFFLLYLFAYHIWWILVASGAILIAVSYFLPNRKRAKQDDGRAAGTPEGEVVDQSSNAIPEKWDEKEISLILGRQQDSNLALLYVKQIIDRFVYGQAANTMKSRLQFLEEQNNIVRTYIERQRLAGQFNRVGWEEKAATEKAKSAADRTKEEAELEKLRIEAEKEEVLLRKEQAARKRADLNRDSSSAKSDGGKERENDLKKLEQRIEKLKERIRITTADPTLDEEVRMRIVNRLNNELEKAEEEYAQML